MIGGEFKKHKDTVKVEILKDTKHFKKGETAYMHKSVADKLVKGESGKVSDVDWKGIYTKVKSEREKAKGKEV